MTIKKSDQMKLMNKMILIIFKKSFKVYKFLTYLTITSDIIFKEL